MDSVIRNPNQMHLESLKKMYPKCRSFKGIGRVLERAVKYPQACKFHTYYLDKKIQNAKSTRTESLLHHFAVLKVDNLKSDPNKRITLDARLRDVTMEDDDSKFLAEDFRGEWLQIRLDDCGIID